MNSIKYSYQLLILVLWVIGVGLLFRFSPDRQMAGAIAGVIFVAIPLVLLVSELRQAQRHWYQLVAVGVFLVVSALPIFLLRIFNWGTDFNELSLLGVTGPQLHKLSNVLYLAMMATTAFCWLRARQSKPGS